MHKKNPPRVSNAETQRAINEIYAQINEIIQYINSIGDNVKSKDSSGAIGQLRVKKVDSNRLQLETKTPAGWKIAKIGENNVNFE